MKTAPESAMRDLNSCIEDLTAIRDRINTIITELYRERPRDRRGRTSMGAEERLEVSARLKRYWAGRRNAEIATVNRLLESLAPGDHLGRMSLERRRRRNPRYSPKQQDVQTDAYLHQDPDDDGRPPWEERKDLKQ